MKQSDTVQLLFNVFFYICIATLKCYASTLVNCLDITTTTIVFMLSILLKSKGVGKTYIWMTLHGTLLTKKACTMFFTKDGLCSN